PLSPPEGEASQGEHPLFGSSRRPSEVIAIWGMPERRGQKHEVQRAPKSDTSVPCKDFYRVIFIIFFYKRKAGIQNWIFLPPPSNPFL
ncbi:MAG: hypothetical protein V1862_13055, partial [Methanobacteriota archaeon]